MPNSADASVRAWRSSWGSSFRRCARRSTIGTPSSGCGRRGLMRRDLERFGLSPMLACDADQDRDPYGDEAEVDRGEIPRSERELGAGEHEQRREHVAGAPEE